MPERVLFRVLHKDSGRYCDARGRIYRDPKHVHYRIDDLQRDARIFGGYWRKRWETTVVEIMEFIKPHEPWNILTVQPWQAQVLVDVISTEMFRERFPKKGKK